MKRKCFQKLNIQTHLVSTEVTLIVRLHFWVGYGNVLLEKTFRSTYNIFVFLKKTKNDKI